MRNKAITKDFYINLLGFKEYGNASFEGYLMLEKDQIQIHFFEHKDLEILDNYGQVYIRSNDIEKDYQTLINQKVTIHPSCVLSIKPWGQKEFAILDPDYNLLTFGQEL